MVVMKKSRKLAATPMVWLIVVGWIPEATWNAEIMFWSNSGFQANMIAFNDQIIYEMMEPSNFVLLRVCENTAV